MSENNAESPAGMWLVILGLFKAAEIVLYPWDVGFFSPSTAWNLTINCDIGRDVAKVQEVFGIISA